MKDTWEIVEVNKFNENSSMITVEFTIKNKKITDKIHIMDTMDINEVEMIVDNRLKQLQVNKVSHNILKGLKKNG